MARKIITYSDKQVDEFIKSFCADTDPTRVGRYSKSKKPTAEEKPREQSDFDANSINLNILGGEGKEPTRKAKSVPSFTKVTKTTDMVEVTEATYAPNASPQEAENEPKVSQLDEPSVSIAKPTRISAKMRRATRAEFCDAYTGKVDTKKGKPIAITASNMKRLYRLCNLSGDRNACPTYIINNLLSEFLDAVEPESKRWGELD